MRASDKTCVYNAANCNANFKYVESYEVYPLVLRSRHFAIEFCFSPRGVKRSQEEQSQVNEQAKTHTLYQFEACPFCVKVRRAMKRQSVQFELRDAKNNEQHRAELEAGGGRVKVPCLRIEKTAKLSGCTSLQTSSLT